jgi:hypothetical protein
MTAEDRRADSNSASTPFAGMAGLGFNMTRSLVSYAPFKTEEREK